MAVTITNNANITFALLMVHNVFCKINEYRARFRLLEQILLTENKQKTVDTFSLKKEFGEAYPIVAEHLACIGKAQKKLPGWVKAGCILAKTPYEQSTSENIALFHAHLAGNVKMLSITGGLGVDDVAFRAAGSEVTSLDPDACLNELFRYNAAQLNISGIQRITTTAESFMDADPGKFDLVFADPDRRPQGNRTAGFVEQHSPDVFTLYRKHPGVATRWIIKLSPMTDTGWLLTQELPMDIYVVESDSEVREVLCDLYPGASGAVKLVIVEGGHHTIIGDFPEPFEKTSFTVFAEPSAGCIKSGLNHRIGEAQGLQPLNPYNTYFTGNALLPAGTGRNFKLLNTLRGSLNQMAAALGGLGINSATVSARDFVIKPEEILKKLKLRDGGSTYLFFTGRGEKACYVCEKI